MTLICRAIFPHMIEEVYVDHAEDKFNILLKPIYQLSEEDYPPQLIWDTKTYEKAIKVIKFLYKNIKTEWI